MKTQTIVPLDHFSDDLLSALIARDKVRKVNGSPSTRPHDFIAHFNAFIRVRSGKNDKETARLEREKKQEILAYIKEHLGVTNEMGELTGVIVD